MVTILPLIGTAWRMSKPFKNGWVCWQKDASAKLAVPLQSYSHCLWIQLRDGILYTTWKNRPDQCIIEWFNICCNCRWFKQYKDILRKLDITPYHDDLDISQPSCGCGNKASCTSSVVPEDSDPYIVEKIVKKRYNTHESNTWLSGKAIVQQRIHGNYPATFLVAYCKHSRAALYRARLGF